MPFLFCAFASPFHQISFQFANDYEKLISIGYVGLTNLAFFGAWIVD